MSSIVFNEKTIVPESIVDHAAFRKWIRTADIPNQCHVSFLDGSIWVDSTMEYDVHNQLVFAITLALGKLIEAGTLGRFWIERMLLSNLAVGLSTEPDAMYASWETLRSRRAELVGKSRGNFEVAGAPDMVLEVVSRGSVRKDTKVLPVAYWKAGIPEYWLIDPRSEPLRFDILRTTAAGFRRVRTIDGWRKSRVFGAEFRIVQSTDPLGGTAYRLESR